MCGHVARPYEMNIFYKILFGKSESKRLLERTKLMWKDNIVTCSCSATN
jgi:hypothetical protein